MTAVTFRFWLGTHETSWLERAAFPLFVSHRRLRLRRSLPRAAGPWALDSGGFTALSGDGQWDMTPRQYVTAVERYAAEIGRLEWAAPMDWMCEPAVRGRTGKTVTEHQQLTVDNYLRLRDIAPQLPFVPVLQGWDLDDYLRCADLYAARGVDLSREPLTGIGSVCRRQATAQIAGVVAGLADAGIRLHGFGVKIRGLAVYGGDLASADSMAWSARGRRVPGCGRGRHKNEANCFEFAAAWRRRLLAGTEWQQLSFGSILREAS
ncbi:MAG TPA: hypothetical protein VNH17_08010 [Streptosporangiaceae bacterium]|nr:hypothetical protein [Streptosporangiaceae bacterium]